MKERRFRSFRRKLGRLTPVQRDVFGRRRALPSEIQRAIKKSEDFRQLERHYLPMTQDILDKND